MGQLTQATVQTPLHPASSLLIKSNLLQRTAITPIHNPTLQRCSNSIECPACRQKRLEREGTLQRAAVNSASTNSVPPIVRDVLNSPGQPLDTGTRAFMEPRFGHDFSRVRVHNDARAAESARSVNALAYTVGRDVVFGTGQYAPGTSEGRRLMAHELTHVVQQGVIKPTIDHSQLTIDRTDSFYESEAVRQADTTGSGHTLMALNSVTLQRQPTQLKGCTVKEPENCPTYEQWVSQFARLPHFLAKDTAPGGTQLTGQRVLGDKPASHDTADPQTEVAPPFIGARAADQFIDHPTDQWVRTNLPEELRETAYRLPSDCADIAVILRHVWLFSHRRTEKYQDWTVGLGAEKTTGSRVKRIGQVIGQMHTGNVKSMVNAYSDPSGKPLRSFADLRKLLHPGDILVWEHHDKETGLSRTGGHTQTIVDVISDDSGQVKQIIVLQGNQPIFKMQADEIREFQRQQDLPITSEGTLRHAPARRIEVSQLGSKDLLDKPLARPKGSKDPQVDVWTWSDSEHTTLVVAGPPASAVRPSKRGRKSPTLGNLSDWPPVLRKADLKTLQGIFEAALLAMRATLESEKVIPDNEALNLGETAGEQLWKLAKQAQDLGSESHFATLQRIRITIQALGQSPFQSTLASQRAIQKNIRDKFTIVDEAFHMAARGATTIDFNRRVRRHTTVIKVMLTGFDPFNTSDVSLPPRSGEWNPSGAAVLALDGSTIDVDSRIVVAVEGVVLPVSFEDFKSGMVEKIVRAPAQSVDAILTVSEDPGLPVDQPVRIERFAVGVHRLNKGVLEAIPPAESGGLGEAIIEAPAPLEPIATATARKALGKRPAIPQPTIGTDILFQFANPNQADQALTALGLTPQGQQEVAIDDPAALQQVIQTMQRNPNGTDINFRASGQNFQAKILRGPGGSFLSNEVSFRVLRLLGESQSSPSPFSFHVHTQTGSVIPEGAKTKAERAERRRDLAAAMRVRSKLIDTLQRMIQAVAKQVIARRKQSSSSTP